MNGSINIEETARIKCAHYTVSKTSNFIFRMADTTLREVALILIVLLVCMNNLLAGAGSKNIQLGLILSYFGWTHFSIVEQSIAFLP